MSKGNVSLTKLRFVFQFLLDRNRKLDFYFGFGMAEISFLPEITVKILFESLILVSISFRPEILAKNP